MPKDSPDRDARVAEIRRQIAAGTYETREKLFAAVDKLLPRLEQAEVKDPPSRQGE